jgi:hypothetical protein
MSSLGVKIEEVATTRLRSSEIGYVSVVIYLQSSNYLRFMMQEIQHKSLDTSDVIKDTRSKEKRFHW